MTTDQAVALITASLPQATAADAERRRHATEALRAMGIEAAGELE